MINREYTKHYYIEGERVCSKIGGGFGNAPNDIDTQVPYLAVAHKQQSEDLWGMVKRGAECTEYDPGYVQMNAKLVSAENHEKAYEGLRYFYHTDHLGSSSFISDASGNACQHLQYLPFGETFIDERQSDGSYNTPYKFSGKEKDDETQYSYFGARYYDSDLSIWLSVDPMASKYPSLSPLAYCANNPVVLVDQDGKDIDISKLTNSGHLAGFVKFLSTDEGKAFICQYLKAGTYTFGGYSLTVASNGSRANDILSIQTSNEQGTVNMNSGSVMGVTEAFTKNDYIKLANVNENIDISEGIFERVTLNDAMSDPDESAATLGHEIFIHVDKDAQRLNNIDTKKKMGAYRYLNEYIKDLNRVGNSGKMDHGSFYLNGNGKYQGYMNKLDKLFKTDFFSKYFENDKNNYCKYHKE